MNEEQMDIAAKMWVAGYLVRAIANEVGLPEKRVYDVASRHRDRFPHRQRSSENRRQFIVPAQLRSSRIESTDRMQWLTEDGAFVTLPKISFIECPRMV